MHVSSSKPDKYKPIWTSFWFEVFTFVVLFLPAYMGQWAFAILIITLAIMTQREIFNIAAYQLNRTLQAVGAIGTIILLGSVTVFGLHTIVPMLIGSVMAILLVGLSIPTERNQLNNLTLLCFSMIYPTVFLAYIIALHQLDNGFIWIVMLYGIVEIHDGFANMMGRILGKRRLFPNISPGKSVEGTAFGVVMSLTLIPLMKIFVFKDIPVIHLISIVLMIDVLTITGDLVASKFKRMVNIKDSGQVIPHRGGFLDIYDALIFASPIAYFYISHFFA